ncbi:MAG: MinD/ParA family ATP-binding protein [Myxococcota bacterium]
MARELSDVLDYFLPGRDETPAARVDAARPEAPVRATESGFRGLLPLAVPVTERDVVHVAFVWNLAIEIARAARRAVLLVPDDPALQPLRECLPTPTSIAAGVGPEFVFSGADDLGALARDARELGRSPHGRGPALAPTLVPTRWIRPDPDGASLLRHPILFATPEASSLHATQSLLERIFEAAPGAEPGVTIHGVHSIQEAEHTFDRISLRCETSLGRPLRSYGLLLDDLQVYRAAVERRPVTATKPNSLASRALTDVARLLIEDHTGPVPEGRPVAQQ